MVEEEVFETFLSGLYLDNCNKLKYGEFNSYLASQYGLERDQYPSTLTNAHQALATTKIEQAYWEKQKKASKSSGSSNSNMNTNANQSEHS